MIPGIFVTATGTDVGKTIITAGIMRQLRKRGMDAMVMKPVQTGADYDASGCAVAPDVRLVLQASGIEVDSATMAHVAPYIFGPACSPHLAARLTGRSIRIDTILQSVQWLSERHEMLVVEGAGGLMVPLGETSMIIDLIRALAMPAVLVAHSGLGTINHVLLSLEALKRYNIPVLGVILNETCPVAEVEQFIHEDNARAIKVYGAVQVLARISWLGAPPSLTQLDAALAECDFLGRSEP